jgi:hypothetical protein
VYFGAGAIEQVGNMPGTAFSADGTNWTTAGVPLFVGGSPVFNSSVAYDSVSFVNSQFVMSGLNLGPGSVFTGAVAVSPDGVNWTPHLTPVSTSIASASFGAGCYVAVGRQGVVLQSAAVAPPPSGITLGPVSLVSLNRTFAQVTIPGAPGQSFRAQGSSDLRQWTALSNMTLSGPTGALHDISTNLAAARFYRTISP